MKYFLYICKKKIMEKCKFIPGFEGFYQIDIGIKDVKCLNVKTGKWLSNKPNKNNRISWGLRKNGITYNRQSARWIAFTFPELIQGEWFEGAEIDHIDTDSLNNHPSNLKWTDRKGNCNNPKTLEHYKESNKGKGYQKKGCRKKRNAKWVIQLSLNNEILHFYPGAKDAERKTNIPSDSIYRCCNHRKSYKSAGGYKWEFSI